MTQLREILSAKNTIALFASTDAIIEAGDAIVADVEKACRRNVELFRIAAEIMQAKTGSYAVWTTDPALVIKALTMVRMIQQEPDDLAHIVLAVLDELSATIAALHEAMGNLRKLADRSLAYEERKNAKVH